MDLNEQIISFIFSFLYGVIVQKLYQLSYEHIHTKKQIYSFLNSLLFMINIIIIQVTIKSLSIPKIITIMIDLSYIIIMK